MNHRAALATLVLALSTCWPLAASAQGPSAIKGEVLEVQNVEGYTYLRLKTLQGEVWAAVPTTAVNKGAVVNIANPMTMQNFESKTLKKHFDKIVFGAITPVGAKEGMARPGAPAAATMLPMAPTSPTTQAAPMGNAMANAHPNAAAPVKVEKVAKASGPEGRTVAEVVKGKASLKDKPVVVQARVVKVNNGIMGKNWWHLQDGSGAAQDGSHDMLVTTQETAAVGDLVTVRGTVRTDVTLGAGYAYAVMVEDAKLRK
jgi:hypothetical protein